MSHKEQVDFVVSVKNKFPDRFQNCRVLDIGSLDINGNNRFLFENSKYLGLDIGLGPNVDIVCRGHEFKDSAGFDIIISTECLEHDEFWSYTLINAIRLLRPNGLLVFTSATPDREEHGTRRTSPSDSPYTSLLPNDYYRNLTEADIRQEVNIDGNFIEYQFSVWPHWPQGLFFWGIKRGYTE